MNDVPDSYVAHDAHDAPDAPDPSRHRVGSDRLFFTFFIGISVFYVLMIVGMLLADVCWMTVEELLQGDSRRRLIDGLMTREIAYSIWLSLISCTLTAILSVIVAVPIGYLMSRFAFRGREFVDTVLDIPIVLPPLVVGVSLLVLFRYPPFRWISDWVVFELPSVVLAQFMVACAFSVRTMRATYDQISPRAEQVALTLGCSRGQAFLLVVLPESRRGIFTAGTLAWARSLGEFGPILIFAGSTRLHTEVLPTTVFLEMQAGQLGVALAVSIIMVVLAMVVLLVARRFGNARTIA